MAVQDYNGNQIVVVCTIFLVLTYVSVLLRCFVRIKILKTFSADDWFMLTALVNFTLTCTVTLLALRYGMGHHNADVDQADRMEALKYQFLSSTFYVSNMMFIKLAIALFLLRLAVRRVFRWTLNISIAVVTIFSVTMILYRLLRCMPVAAQWDFTITPQYCGSGNSFIAAAYSISVMNMITDWMYALMPIFMIFPIQMTMQKKLTVGFILSMGVFASIATLIRLPYLADLSHTSDILFTGTISIVWLIVEPGLAITAAALVTIRPLLRAFNLRGFESAQSPYPNNRTSLRHTGQHISLRSDLLADSWSQSISSGQNNTKMTVSIGAKKVEGSGVAGQRPTSDAGSEDFMMQGIIRTTDVTVTHDARSVSIKVP